MADLVITAANVVAQPGAKVEHGIAGATETAGQVLYGDPTDNKLKLADNNSATVAVRKPVGLALNGAANGQPMAVLKEGPVVLGVTLVPGTAYYLSDTPGGICTAADLAAGEYPTLVGLAISTAVLDFRIHQSGVAIPA